MTDRHRAVLAPNLEDPDDFHARLIAAHEGLTESASADLNARLLFLLANQIGSAAVLAECITLAREAGQGSDR